VTVSESEVVVEQSIDAKIDRIAKRIEARTRALKVSMGWLNRQTNAVRPRLTKHLESLSGSVRLLCYVMPGSEDIKRLDRELTQLREDLRGERNRRELLKLQARYEELNARLKLLTNPDRSAVPPALPPRCT